MINLDYSVRRDCGRCEAQGMKRRLNPVHRFHSGNSGICFLFTHGITATAVILAVEIEFP